LHGVGDAAEAGHDDGRDRDLPLLDFLDEPNAVAARHLQVGEEDAVMVLTQSGERLLTVADRVHLDLTVGLQKLVHLLPDLLVVVCDQNSPLHGRISWMSGGRGVPTRRG